MTMNTLTAQEGMWLFNGESFARKVSGFGSLDKWSEVTDEYKAQWEAEHPVELPEGMEEQNNG